MQTKLTTAWKAALRAIITAVTLLAGLYASKVIKTWSDLYSMPVIIPLLVSLLVKGGSSGATAKSVQIVDTTKGVN
jgi:hypothetical protein